MDEASRSVRASSSSIQTILHGYLTANRSTASAHRHTQPVYCHNIKKKKNQISSSKALIIVSIIILVLPRLSGVRENVRKKIDIYIKFQVEQHTNPLVSSFFFFAELR